MRRRGERERDRAAREKDVTSHCQPAAHLTKSVFEAMFCLKLNPSGGQQAVTAIKRFQKPSATRSSIIYRVNASVSHVVGHPVTYK